MTDKVQKIREEVVRMHNLLPVVDGDNLSVNYADRICTTLEMYIDSLQEEPVNTLKLSNVERTIKNWKEEPVRNPIDFEQELYKAFGQVKDFTLGMRIAKWFYDVGKKSREPVSEDLEKVVEEIVEPTILNAYGTKELAKRLRNTICGTSVSEDLEEAIDTYLKSYWGGEKEKQEWPFLKKMAIYFTEWQKQKDSIPVSEELEKAAEEYIEYTPRYDIGYELEEGNDPTEIDCFTIDEAIAAFKEGAKWQLNKIRKKYEENRD